MLLFHSMCAVLCYAACLLWDLLNELTELYVKMCEAKCWCCENVLYVNFSFNHYTTLLLVSIHAIILKKVERWKWIEIF